MNRMLNFEDEYRKYAKSSAPDLWDRIEAGIDAISAEEISSDDKVQKQTDTEAEEDGKVISITASESYRDYGIAESEDTEIEDTDNRVAEPSVNNAVEETGNPAGGREPSEIREDKISEINKAKKRIHITRYTGIIAAAACGLIVISATGWISRSSKSNSAAESAAYAPAAPAAEAAYEASAEAAAEAETPAEKAESSYDYEATSEAADDSYEYEATSEAADDSYEDYEEAAENTTYAEESADGSSYADENAYAEEEAADEAPSAAGAYADNSKQSESNAEAVMMSEAAGSSYDAAENEYSADGSQMSDMTLAADKAEDLKASRDQSVAAGKKKTSDKYRQKEQSLTVKLDSLKEEDGKLICTMTVTDPGITKHKQNDVITAVINEPIKSRVSKFYERSRSSKDDTYVVILLPTDSGLIVTDIRREF
ncbi:MAG: hypothetical protein K6G27_02645 [Lachnospiraceae bacterium]|nr:hypothetical protein [Lachnospiraceae bacterium]